MRISDWSSDVCSSDLAPLGYIEGQLRLRFGQAQPRAVATIINAAREPVTLPDLRAGLTALADQVTVPPANASWWEALEHEAREIITIHRASTRSEEHTSELQSLMRISYAVFCLKKKKNKST